MDGFNRAGAPSAGAGWRWGKGGDGGGVKGGGQVVSMGGFATHAQERKALLLSCKGIWQSPKQNLNPKKFQRCQMKALNPKVSRGATRKTFPAKIPRLPVFFHTLVALKKKSLQTM